MDVIQTLKDVTNLNQYISVTQEVITKGKSAKIQNNLTTVLTLNKIRSLEIEYINKCEENGVACFILERLLALPPSKTWDMLAKQLICLIQYWLQAIRKHLMNHSNNWWTFLRQLLIYIKDMIVKAPCVPNLLVEYTAECLLELATADRPDTSQKYEILHTLNLYCSEASREIRFAMRNKFSAYFIKLSTQMATCGYLPCQFSTLECLIRWLVPRDDVALRSSAANKWFPFDLYPKNAVQMFLRSDWLDFFPEARAFLNMLNYANGLVTSAICRRLLIGNLHVITGGERQQYWLDVNSSESALSVMLEPRALARLAAAAPRACHALLLHNDIVQSVRLHSESGVITLSINTTKPVSIRPLEVSVPDADTVVINISSRTDLRKMDVALTRVFGDKYQALLNVNSQITISPERSFNKGTHDSSDDTRFSHPEVKRKRHCGYITRTRNSGGINTPSSVSTSSLLHLREKLTALPRFKFDKEPISVCKEPELSCVSEFTEKDDRSITTVSTRKLYSRYKVGVCQRTVRANKSQSDSETVQSRPKSQSDSEAIQNRTKITEPVADKNISDDNTSIFFNTTYENIIPNAPVEPMTSKTNRNIVDQIVQEALQRDKIADSGVHTDDNKKSEETENSEAIEGTPVNVIEKPKRNKKPKSKVFTVVSTTDDESNTEVVKETPVYVNVRNRRNNDKESDVSKTFDMNDVENFFSQHFSKTIKGDISPTLAKMINETTSESENLDDNFLILNNDLKTEKELFQVNEIEIIECLNDIVDKVCNEFDKATRCINKEVDMGNTNEILMEKEPNSTCTSTKQKENKPAKGKKTRSRKANIKIKLKTPKKSKQVTAKEIKNSKPGPKKMSTIVEQTEESVVEASESVEVKRQSPILKLKFDNKQTPISRRKRKLYSPNADNNDIETASKMSDTDDDEVLANFKTKTKHTSSASCYKEIEKERKRYIRSKPRRSGKRFAEPQSPRTVQNNVIFDNLKETVENTEKIIIADRNTKLEAYNFTSESEDEDFRKKKIEVKNRISSTATSMTSLGSNTRGRKKTRKNYSESKSSNDEITKKPVVKRRQTIKKKGAPKRKAIVDDVIQPVAELVDERMRNTTDVLNTSFIINQPEHEETRDNGPLINDRHELEPIVIKPPTTVPRSLKLKKTEIIKVKTEKVKSEKVTKNDPKRNKNALKVDPDKDGDGTISPLPGLVVEVAPEVKQDANDSLTINMLHKFKKIYHEGGDETNTTQNMLSDIERNNNNSKHNISSNVTDQIYFAAYDETVVHDASKRSNKATLLNNRSRKSVEEYMDDVMEICSIPDRKSDISIATDGITAHGDLEEDPPSLKTIKKHIQGNRQVVDLNQSVKEYFEKLTNEINRTSIDSKEPRKRNFNRKQEKNINKSISSDNSPVVSIKRLSMEDIRKYLPSCRSSETEEESRNTNFLEEPRNSKTYKKKQRDIFNKSASSENSPVFSIARRSMENRMAEKESKIANDNKNKGKNKINKSMSSEKSPVVAIKRISMEDMNRYLSSRNSPGTDVEKYERNDTENPTQKVETLRRKIVVTPKNLSGSSKSPVVGITRISLEEFNKWLPPMPVNRNSDNSDSEDENPPCSSQIKRISGNLKIVFSNDKENLSPKRGLHSRYTKKTRTSDEASPKQARTPDDISQKITRLTNNVTRKSLISPVRSFEDFAQHLQSGHVSDEDCSNTTKSIFRTRSAVRKDARILIDSQDKIDVKISESSQDKSDVRIFEVPQEFSRSKCSTKHVSKNFDTSIRSSLKRSSSPINKGGKKSRYEEPVTIESGPSVSSIHEWFKRNEVQKPRINDPLQPFNDAYNIIMEKIDTTLVEHNQNTSKELVKLFVDIDERFKITEDYLKSVVKNVEEQIKSVKIHLKEQAIEMMKKDHKWKRDMISLLKEDVKTVFGMNTK